MNKRNRFWKWLAGKLPRMLVFWAAVRVVADKVSPEMIEVQNDWTIDKLNRWLEYARDRKVWWHSQNLLKDKPMWKHGRAWLHTWRLEWRVEWSLLKEAHHCSLEVSMGGEHDIQFSIGIPYLINLYLTVSHLFPYSWLPREWDRTTGIRIFEGYIWFNIWNDNSWAGHGKPKWQDFCINVPDFLFGRSKYNARTIERVESKVTLPEGDYPVTVEMKECTWKRPRWPKIDRVIRAEVEPIDQKRGIPSHAGKGECEWDLDDDALFSSTVVASTPQEAVEKVAAGILRDRQKYGMPALAL